MHVTGLGNVGKVTVALSDDGGMNPTKIALVDASTIATTQSEVYFTLASTLTCDGAADYKVGVTKDAAGSSGAKFYRDGTAGNWFHVLRTSTDYLAAPAAGDNLHIVGATVTMDSIDSTSHGTVDIGAGGKVEFDTTLAHNPILKLAGVLNVWYGGTLSIGTGVARIPSDSIAILDFACTSPAQYGLVVYGTFNAYGNPLTYVKAKITADIAIDGTALTTDVSTGWLSGDVIGLPSTTPTTTQYEQGDLNGDAAGTSLTIHGFAGAGGGVANAHSGTLPFRGDVVNLTRNVKVRGASITNTAYVRVVSGGTVNASYAEFYWLGSNAAYGIDLPAGVLGSVEYSAFHLSGTSTTYKITIPTFLGNVMCLRLGNVYLGIYATTGGSITNNFFNSAYVTEVYPQAGDISNNTFTGGSQMLDTALWTTSSGTFNHNTYYGNSSVLSPAAANNITLHGLVMWRNHASGYQFTLNSGSNWLLEDCYFYGRFTTADYARLTNCVFQNVVFESDAAYPSTYGFYLPESHVYNLRFENCTFGVATAFSYDFSASYLAIAPNTIFDNCNLASPVPIELGASPGYAGASSYWSPGGAVDRAGTLKFERWGNGNGVHRTYTRNSLIQTDTAIHDGSGRSERITPHRVVIPTAVFPSVSSVMKMKAASGSAVTFSVRVRKSAAADAGGADYTGSQPRLMLRVNYATGVTEAIAAVPLDTMTVAVGSWETLTGASPVAIDDGVMEAYVDCDGNVGWINVDNWSGAASSWFEGLPANGVGGGASSAATRAYPSVQ